MRSKPMLWLLVLAILAFPLGGILADTPVIVPDRVEEDWQLIIATPDVTGVGPQITTSMSPLGDSTTPFAAFDLNYREYPSFQAGGMQIQVWAGDKVVDTSSQGSSQFTTPGETITWTQRLSVAQDGTVYYRILNGQSTTWGSFGQAEGQLQVKFPPSVGSLAGYRPSNSVTNSGASWESNRVSQLALVAVRYYAGGQLVFTDSTTRTLIRTSSSD